MRRFLIALIAGTMVIGSIAGALAQRQGPKGGKGGGRRPDPETIIRRLDKDGDGKISKKEFRGPAEKFGSIDANRDGFITEAEMRAARKKAGARRGPGAGGSGTSGSKFSIINTHVHINPRVERGRDAEKDWRGAVQNAIKSMDGEGVKLSIIMSPPQPSSGEGKWDIGDYLEIAREHPGRFAVLGGGSTLNPMIDGTSAGEVSESVRREFEKTAENLLKQGAIGFGEMTALHFSFRPGHPFEETSPDHPLFLLLADIAARRGVPIDLHMEAVSEDIQTPEELKSRSSNNPDTVSENISALERLLAHNRGAKIIWVHLGWDSTGHRSAALTRRLLRKHPNLFLSMKIRHSINRDTRMLQRGRGLDAGWRGVIVEFPDRFMVGTDGFYPSPMASGGHPPPNFRSVLRVLKSLPPKITRMVAYRNAQRIYGLNVVREPKEPPSAGGPPQGRMMGGAPPPQIAKGGKPLTEAEVRRRIIGNTIYFKAPRGNKKLYVHFAKGGAVVMQVEGKPGRVISKRWFFKKKGRLCRTVGKNNRNHCTKVRAGGGGLTFFNKKFRYEVKVLKGRQLPR